MENLLTIPVDGLGKAKSVEAVNAPEHSGWSSRRHSDVSNLKRTTLRRNNYSFDDLFNRCQVHTSMMDFIDDSDNWSYTSLDSSATDPQHNRMSTLSLASITANPGSGRKKHTETLDSFVKEPSTTTTSESNPLHSNSRRGLSHSMILNWVFSKKYPTITELGTDSTTAPGSALDSNKNAVLSEATNMVSANKNAEHKFSYRDPNALAPSNW